MKVETLLFSSGVLFFTPIAIVYGIVTQWNEPVGVAGILLTAGLSLLIGLYLWLTSRRIDARPEDDPDGEIREGFGEQGFFAPYSWWPFWLALASAIVFAGMAVGWWLLYIGLGASTLALVGWVYEYYRGEHAH